MGGPDGLDKLFLYGKTIRNSTFGGFECAKPSYLLELLLGLGPLNIHLRIVSAALLHIQLSVDDTADLRCYLSPAR